MEIRKKQAFSQQQTVSNYNTFGNNAAKNKDYLFMTQHARPPHKSIGSSSQPPWENITFKYNPLHQDIDTIEEKTEFGESQTFLKANNSSALINKRNNENEKNLYLESVVKQEQKFENSKTAVEAIRFDSSGFGYYVQNQRAPTKTSKTPSTPHTYRNFLSPNPINNHKIKYKNLSLRNRANTRVAQIIQRPHTQHQFRSHTNNNNTNVQFKNKQQQFIRARNFYRNNAKKLQFQQQQKNGYHKFQANNNNINHKKALIRKKSKLKSVLSKKLAQIQEKNNEIEYCFLNCCNFINNTQNKSKFKFKFLKKCPCGTSNMNFGSYYEVSYVKQREDNYDTNDTDVNYIATNNQRPISSASS